MKINAWVQQKFEELSIDDAARQITAEWVECGLSCDQTVIDLADALRASVELRNAALAAVGYFAGQNQLTEVQVKELLVDAIKPLL